MYQRFTLPNGLSLLVVPMPQVKSVTVMVGVRAGGRYETKETNGIAHFTEHMFFKGTKKRPTSRDIAREMDSIGGEFNASTGNEITLFYTKSAAEHLNLGLDVLSDMIQNSKFDSGDIDRERGVVTEEINMYQDTPRDYISEVYQKLLYGDHPLGWDILGTKKTVSFLKRSDFLDYLGKWFYARNMVLCVAGKVDFGGGRQSRFASSLTASKENGPGPSGSGGAYFQTRPPSALCFGNSKHYFGAGHVFEVVHQRSGKRGFGLLCLLDGRFLLGCR